MVAWNFYTTVVSTWNGLNFEVSNIDCRLKLFENFQKLFFFPNVHDVRKSLPYVCKTAVVLWLMFISCKNSFPPPCFEFIYYVYFFSYNDYTYSIEIFLFCNIHRRRRKGQGEIERSEKNWMVYFRLFGHKWNKKLEIEWANKFATIHILCKCHLISI